MRILPVLLAVLLLAPSALADHPGSNAGLDRLPAEDRGLVHRLQDVDAAMARWEGSHPGLVERETVGTTGVLGFPLLAVRVTDESVAFDAAATATGEKVRVYLDGGHHGNEFLGVDIIMYYLEDILAQAGQENTAAFLRTHEVWALPIVNVEGNYLDTRKNANQVDVNRNYGFEWGGPGSGDLVLDLNYRGEAPFSEPEALANAEFARRLMPDVWITMHTGIAEFYWPWGWTHDKSPDHVFFESIEQPFEDATNGRVDAMMAAELYLAAGATDDWGYGQLGIPTHTFEVHEDQFVPVYGNGLAAELAQQLGGLDFVVRNATYWGAWLSMHARDGELRIWNEGWGAARDVVLRYEGRTTVVEEIAPGQMHAVPLGDGRAVLQYRQLLVDAPEAKVRTVVYDPAAAAASQDASSLVPLLGLAALAGLATLRRR